MAKNNNEEKKAIFIGPKLISIGNIIEKDGIILFKKVPSKPFIDKYVTIMGNIDKYKSETKKLYDPARGETDIEVKVFRFDLKQQEYEVNVPIEYILENKSMKLQLQKLKLFNNKLINQLYESGNEDIMRKKFKDDIKWLNEIKFGNEGSGGGGGSSFGGSPFGGFGR